MFSRTARVAAAASRMLANLEMLVCKVLIVAFTGLLVVNVGMRYVLNAPLFFAEELAIYILIWMAFLAISVSIHEDSQVRFTLVTDAMPRKARRLALLVAELAVAAMLAVILVRSVGWILSPSASFDFAVTLGWPKWPFFLIIPVFAAAALCHVTARIVTTLAGPSEVRSAAGNTTTGTAEMERA